MKPAIDEWLKGDPERYFIVVCGPKRVFFGKINKFEALRAAGAPEASNIKTLDSIVVGAGDK